MVETALQRTLGRNNHLTINLHQRPHLLSPLPLDPATDFQENLH
jgi:hypothetical protein